MKKSKGLTDVDALGALFILVALVVTTAVVTVWTDSNLDFWLTHLKGHAVHVPMWLAFILTLVGNGVIILLNVVSEIAKLAL